MWDGCYNGTNCIQFVRNGSCGMDVTMVSAVSTLSGRARVGWMLQWYLYPLCEGWLIWDGCYNGINCIQFVRDGSCGMDVTMVSAVSSL